MEQEFQTSFIPKKPLTEEKVTKRPTLNIFNFIGIIVFLMAAVGAGGIYFWKITLTKQVEDAKISLQKARDKFEISSVRELQLLDKRLNAGNELVNNHIVMAPIFQALQEMTLRTVRFTKFSYTLTGSPTVKDMQIKMSGVAKNYNALALQADMLGKNKYFRDPVFSNLSLDDKGNILFEVQFSLDPVFLSYIENIKRTTAPLSNDASQNQTTQQ
jgi:hypothetical protein